jgi:hypothetical protein
MRRTRSAVAGTALLAVVSLGAPSAAYPPPVPLAHPPHTRVERAAHLCQHDPPGDEGRPNPGAGPGPEPRRAGRGLRRPTARRLRRRCPPQPDGRDAGAGRARGRLPELRVRQHALVAPELAGVGVRPAQHLRPPGGVSRRNAWVPPAHSCRVGAPRSSGRSSARSTLRLRRGQEGAGPHVGDQGGVLRRCPAPAGHEQVVLRGVHRPDQVRDVVVGEVLA